MDIFIANLKHAIRNRETVTIGGGEFTPQELQEVIKKLEELQNAVKPAGKLETSPYTLSLSTKQTRKHNMQAIIDTLADVLPTGSGIDCQWQFTERKNGSILAHNSFHCMNEHGFYDGWADFTIIFKKDKPLADFVLQFNGKTAQYKNKRYMLRDYLEETIYHFIRDMQGNSVINSKLSDLVK